MDLVAIGGCPRSGTSALCNLLMQDEKIMIFDELQVFSSNWESNSIVKRIITNWLKEGSNFSYLVERSGIKREKFKAFIDQTKPISGKELYDFVKDTTKATMFGDKSPEAYVSIADTLAVKFPEMKFLFSQRDGRGVIASHLRKPRSSVPNIEACVNLWVRMTSRILELKKRIPDRCFIINYDEAVINVEPMLEELSNFLSLDPVLINDLNFKGLPYYRPTHVETWKNEIPDIMSKIHSSKFNDLMSFYNYI